MKTKGFTLIELMVVVVIGFILFVILVGGGIGFYALLKHFGAI